MLSVLAQRRVGNEERAEDSRLGRALGKVVLERVDQHREAERVRPEDELVPLLVRDVTGVGEDLDPLGPLVLRQPHLDRELVEMPDERRHDLQEARRSPVEACNDLIRDLLGSGLHQLID